MKDEKKKTTTDLVEETYKKLKHEVSILDEEIDKIKSAIDTLDLEEITKCSKKVKIITEMVNKSTILVYIIGKKHIEFIKKEHFKTKEE